MVTLSCSVQEENKDPCQDCITCRLHGMKPSECLTSQLPNGPGTLLESWDQQDSRGAFDKLCDNRVLNLRFCFDLLQALRWSIFARFHSTKELGRGKIEDKSVPTRFGCRRLFFIRGETTPMQIPGGLTQLPSKIDLILIFQYVDIACLVRTQPWSDAVRDEFGFILHAR